jgi:endothelin-converting enzyme/putative endopeptidase
MKVLISIGLLAAMPAACTFAQTPAMAGSQPRIELPRIDVTNVDTSASPCDNFFQYACGKLNVANPIPPDQVSWGSFNKLGMWNRQVLHEILETNEANNSARTANEQKIGDFYASCMDQASSGANDAAVIRPLEARIEAIGSAREIAPVLAAVQRAFGSAWAGSDNQTNTAVMGFGPMPDANDVRRVVGGVDQAGLTLPGRDFYLKDDARMKAIREKYRGMVTAMLKMDGMTEEQAQAAAGTVIRMETAMATAQMDNITRRDPNATNNRYTLAQLKTLVPAFDWDGYFTALGAPAVPLYEVSSPEYMKALNGMLTNDSVADWKVYLRWHLVYSASPDLGNQWRDEQFKLVQALTGAKQQPPAWRRCTIATDANLGEALGQVYVAKVFPAASKERVEAMVKNIEWAMGEDIRNATWMQPKTKEAALAKLHAVVDKIGYPDKWIDYSSLTVERSSYPHNVEHATQFELRRQLGFINKPLDKTQWGMTPPTVNAYEDPQTNTINFPAGILAPPFFDAKADDVLNYGAEGAVIGHELTHDFDDQGRKFDVNGNLKDWWTAADTKAYDERGACIATEYTGPVEGVDGAVQNGRLTQGEDTADNGGIHLALAALTKDLQKQGKTLEDKDSSGLTNLQRFFLAYANDWCGTIRPEMARLQVATNPHSVEEERTNNVVGNMPEFDKAFGCKVGQAMVHKTQCRVW